MPHRPGLRPTFYPGWTCNPGYWSDNSCDCECGPPDPYCAANPGGTIFGCTSPQICDRFGECTSAPFAWTCPGASWDDGTVCDCGCGAVDPDCTDATVDSCDTCDLRGSCNGDACPGSIDAADNTTCN